MITQQKRKLNMKDQKYLREVKLLLKHIIQHNYIIDNKKD